MVDRRISDVDYLRFTAIMLMIIFHFSYDLNSFMNIKVNYTALPLNFIGKLSAFLFIFVSGVSCSMSRRPCKKGLQVLSLGMGITAVTFVFFRDEYIRFGILHLLGISMILGCAVRKLNPFIIAVAAAIIWPLGAYLNSLTVKTFMLLPFGLMYDGFITMDYYPLLPYFSLFLFGIVMYKLWFKKGVSFTREAGFIKAVSSKSLWIYIIHQPVIVGIMYAVKYFNN